jgi:cytochrome c biogenesis protein CcmG/thiol:disulfide interchange protein DsbE
MILKKSLQFFLPLIIFFLIFMLLFRSLGLHPNLIPSPLIGKPAPALTLPDLLTQKKISNTRFQGHITLLNVWATWCNTCAEEHAYLMELEKNKKFVLAGLDYKDQRSSAKKWLQEKGNPYQWIAVDEAGDVAIDWGVYGTPETFVIDKKGVVRYKHTGAITEEIWAEKLSPLIEKLRNEP